MAQKIFVPNLTVLVVIVYFRWQADRMKLSGASVCESIPEEGPDQPLTEGTASPSVLCNNQSNNMPTTAASPTDSTPFLRSNVSSSIPGTTGVSFTDSTPFLHNNVSSNSIPATSDSTPFLNNTTSTATTPAQITPRKTMSKVSIRSRSPGSPHSHADSQQVAYNRNTSILSVRSVIRSVVLST